jgi:hypothetical protein
MAFSSSSTSSLLAVSPSSSFATPIATPIASLPLATTAPTASPSPSAPPQNTMTAGAKAGIAIGAAAVVGLLLIFGIYAIRRRRQQRTGQRNSLKNASSNDHKSSAHQVEKAELQTNYPELHETSKSSIVPILHPNDIHQEIDAVERVELPYHE